VGCVTTISACLISRAIDEPLRRAVESVRPLCDEIVVACNSVAPPSETIDGVTVIHTTSCNVRKNCKGPCGCRAGDIVDFAMLRNVGFGRATGDFLVWLDSDDVLEWQDKDVLRQLAERGEPVRFKYEYAYDNAGACDVSYDVLRFVSRAANGWTYWSHPVHEMLHVPGGQDASASSDAVVWKHQRADWAAAHERNYRVALHNLPEWGKSSRFLFYFAQACKSLGKVEEVLRYYKRSHDLEKDPEQCFLTCMYASQHCVKHGRLGEAVTWAHHALAAKPRWARGYFLLGQAHYEVYLRTRDLQDAEVARRFFDAGFSVRGRAEGGMLLRLCEPDFGLFDAHLYYHALCAALGDTLSAISSCRAGLREREHAGLRDNLQRLEASHADFISRVTAKALEENVPAS